MKTIKKISLIIIIITLAFISTDKALDVLSVENFYGGKAYKIEALPESDEYTIEYVYGEGKTIVIKDKTGKVIYIANADKVVPHSHQDVDYNHFFEHDEEGKIIGYTGDSSNEPKTWITLPPTLWDKIRTSIILFQYPELKDPFYMMYSDKDKRSRMYYYPDEKVRREMFFNSMSYPSGIWKQYFSNGNVQFELVYETEHPQTYNSDTKVTTLEAAIIRLNSIVEYDKDGNILVNLKFQDNILINGNEQTLTTEQLKGYIERLKKQELIYGVNLSL